MNLIEFLNYLFKIYIVKSRQYFMLEYFWHKYIITMNNSTLEYTYNSTFVLFTSCVQIRIKSVELKLNLYISIKFN